jgi:hypothetical protein
MVLVAEKRVTIAGWLAVLLLHLRIGSGRATIGRSEIPFHG